MAYRLVESSSDVIVEADGDDLGGALVALAQAFTHVTTHGARVEPRTRIPVRVETQGDLARLAVAFMNELAYLFSTRAFLPADGTLSVTPVGPGHRAEGELHGDAFDPARHSFGTEVKAATLHGARLEATPTGARARVLLDL